MRILLSLTLACLAFAATAQEKIGVTARSTDGKVLTPTNFFKGSSNEIMSAVGGIGTMAKESTNRFTRGIEGDGKTTLSVTNTGKGTVKIVTTNLARMTTNGLELMGEDGRYYYVIVRLVEGNAMMGLAPVDTSTNINGLDFTGGAAYGFNRIITGFSGPTVRLARASDSAEADFGFSPSGLFNTNAVEAWRQSSVVTGVTWYDQTGNGNNAVQTTNSARETYEYSAADGQPCFMGGNLNGNYQRFWKLPAGVAQNPQSFTAFMVYKARNRYPSAAMLLAAPGIAIGENPAGTSLTTDGTVSVQNIPAFGGMSVWGHSGLGGRTNNVLPSDTTPEVLAIISSSTGVHTLAGTRWDAAVSGAVPRFGSQVPAGGSLGKFSFGLSIAEAEARAYIIAREHSVGTARNVVAALASNHGLKSGFTNSLWWVGDSLSAGYAGGNDLRDFAPGHKLAQLQTNFFVRVFARAGKRIDEMDAWATAPFGGAAADQWVAEMGSGNAQCLLWCGYNDFNQGASLATVKARINTFVANRKAAGFSKVYVGTLIPVGTYISPDSLRTDLNAWLMAGQSDADDVIDFAGQGSWAGKMQGDNVHLTEPAGNAEAARVVQEFLQGL